MLLKSARQPAHAPCVKLHSTLNSNIGGVKSTFFLSFLTGSSWSGDALSIALMFPFQLNLPEILET